MTSTHGDTMAKQKTTDTEKQISVLIELMKITVAVQLAEAGATQQLIAKKLRISKLAVNDILRGIKWERK